MLAVMLLSQHRVLSSKTIRLNALCGAQCIGHAVRTWSAVCSEVPHLQFSEGARPHCKEQQMELPNTSPQVVEPNSSCSGYAHPSRPGTSPGRKSTEPGSIFTVLHFPFVIRPFRSMDAKSGKVVQKILRSWHKWASGS